MRCVPGVFCFVVIVTAGAVGQDSQQPKPEDKDVQAAKLVAEDKRWQDLDALRRGIKDRVLKVLAKTPALGDQQVASAVYLALLGPEGLRELGETIMMRTQYAMHKLDLIKGVKAPMFKSPHFKEFTVNFDKTGKRAQRIHQTLLKQYGIHGGKNISKDFPELGQTALYCVTEVHSKDNIDQLAQGLRAILKDKR